MILFIWQDAQSITDNWHSGGSVVVIAPDEARARELANAVENCNIDESEMPEKVGNIESGERVWIFPDAGCC